MNKTLKLALTFGMATLMLMAAGCGDDKKPADKPTAKPAATAAKNDDDDFSALIAASKNPNLTPPKTYTQMWIGSLPGHHAATYKVNGKTQLEEHMGYITMRVDRTTKKIVSIDSKRIDEDASTNGTGKITQYTKWNAK